MTTVQDVINSCRSLWPEHTAEQWDRVGLSVGEPHAPVRKVALALDASLANCAAAQQLGAQMLLTHHPLLLKAVHSVAATNYKGRVITELIRTGMALYSAHTNADIVPDGVSDIIATRLGLQELQPLVPAEHDSSHGIGRRGRLADPLSLQEFVDRAAAIFPDTVSGLRVAGDPQQKVEHIALCGGAGDSLLSNELVLQSDVYLTSDLRHHPAQEFRENNPDIALVDVAHWAAESLWLEVAAQQLSAALPGVEFVVCDIKSDPWIFSAHKQGASK